MTAGASAGGGGGGARATATWFGPEDRPLFGWVHVPRDPGGQGVVLCPSLGLEGEASQMAYRALARSLADAGCTVLRFDYHGTGDSTGFLTDPGRLDEWLSDISAALAYLRGAGATRLHLVGARLGAALAVRAAAAEDDVESLTLWYPWTKGSQFLRYQRALRRLYAMGGGPPTGDGSTEIPGFVLGASVCADLGTLDSRGGRPLVPEGGAGRRRRGPRHRGGHPTRIRAGLGGAAERDRPPPPLRGGADAGHGAGG